ncbi:MAG: PIN domain-containing protein [Candidatus Solibacter sp.]
MILVDSSIWANHFRAADAALVQLLHDRQAGVHSFVVGELAAGNLKNRAQALADFRALPHAQVATEDEVHRLLERHRFYGTGLSWIDLHLLTSAGLAGWKLWTADRALQQACCSLKLDA